MTAVLAQNRATSSTKIAKEIGQPVIIENSTLKGKGPLIVSDADHTNITVTGTASPTTHTISEV